MLNSHICALDIGSSKLSACVAEFKNKNISRIFFESVPSKGVKEGVPVDSIELVSCLTKLMKALREKSGLKIKYIYTNISGQDILTKHSRAIIPLAERGNKVITVSDMERVNEQARILGSNLQEEIVQALAYGYTIDSKSNIMNPLGLYSHRLEVDLYLVCTRLAAVQSLSRSIQQSGYEIKEMFFSGLATSRVCLENKGNEGLNIFCDIGSDITELLIFRDGYLRDIEILPVGGNNLTQILCDELKIPFDLAEDIKKSHAVIGDSAQIKEDKEILVKKTNLYKPIKQRMVSELITQGARNISAKIKGAIEKKLSCYEVNNFIISGRTILLEGFIETLETGILIPVKIAKLSHPMAASLVKENEELAGQKYLTYMTCLGILLEAVTKRPALTSSTAQPAKNLIFKAVNRFKEVYQEYF
ncbi:MAG: cell division protein FtsA [Candidatus Omnitrophica bacterium]|nr:cell division protein FtsA [Candidatus Omnitrophota bacterium]